MKVQIEELINCGEIEKASELLDQYKKINPKDADIFTIETCLYLYSGQMSAAEDVAKKGVRILPTSVDMHYNLANVYELQEDYYHACIEYCKADTILEILGQTERRTQMNISNYINEAITKWSDKIKSLNELTIIQNEIAKMKRFEELGHNCYGLQEKIFRQEVDAIGKIYFVDDKDTKYVGLFKDGFAVQTIKSLCNFRGELLDFTEETTYMVNDNNEYLLPIASEENGVFIDFYKEKEKYHVLQEYGTHFYYYRLNGETKITSAKKCYFGTPIILKHDENRKKLVLNIFIDGLAGVLAKGDMLKEWMPNTYAFFSKGCICENAYHSAEWTYPSVVNFITSVGTLNHMMFHPKIEGCIPEDLTTLAEYFKKKGYYTAMFSGNWRIVPNYGHARGYDRFVYQNGIRYKVGDVINDTIEHIRAFSETDQFVWMSAMDLHDIADEEPLPVSVMRNLSLDDLQYEEKKEKSVRQMNSERKRRRYMEQMKRVDYNLGVLYRYIEEKYDDSDILVSLFSDHGQSYLIPNGGEFLARERANIAFMFRGGDIKKGVSQEIMSSSDYMPIMCKLANIPVDNNKIEGNVPMWFGGQQERDYAFVESLYPGQKYYAAMYFDGVIVFFESEDKCNDDGRFKLGNYKIHCEDFYGNFINDEEKEAVCEKIILEHIAQILLY